MSLSADERDLLRLIAGSPAPLALLDAVRLLYQAGPEVKEGHPDQPAWRDRQIALFAVFAALHDRGLVRVIESPDGLHPDRLAATREGHEALTHG